MLFFKPKGQKIYFVDKAFLQDKRLHWKDARLCTIYSTSEAIIRPFGVSGHKHVNVQKVGVKHYTPLE